MKRVSFEVAKYLKKVGYPQDKNDKTIVYPTKGEFKGTLCGFNSCAPERDKFSINAPTYIDVWLWLWRDKKISIDVEHLYGVFWSVFTFGQYVFTDEGDHKYSDPEEAIIAAIEYLVKHNLI